MAGSIEDVISTLYEMVQDAWSLPLGADKCVLERDKVLDLLDEMNHQLPGEFKQAKTIVDARNEIIDGAKREAEALMKQAEMKARQMISEQEVYTQAKAEAEILLDDARHQADQITAATNAKLGNLKETTIRFVLDALNETVESISGALDRVTTTRSRLDSMGTRKPEEQNDAPADSETAEIDLSEHTEDIPETEEPAEENP